MMTRRAILTGGVLATAAPALAAGGAEPGQSERSSHADEQMVKVLEDIRGELRALRSPCTDCQTDVDTIRGLQRAFVKARGKFPDFLEVAIAVWEHVYDWHVRNQQQILASRTSDGRYTMGFALTTLVLRPDMPENWIGQPFDSKAG